MSMVVGVMLLFVRPPPPSLTPTPSSTAPYSALAGTIIATREPVGKFDGGRTELRVAIAAVVAVIVLVVVSDTQNGARLSARQARYKFKPSSSGVNNLAARALVS